MGSASEPAHHRTPTLIIGPSTSVCGDCGYGADPHATSHDTILAYGTMSGRPGCGTTWERVGTNYHGVEGLEARVQGMRPDLEWVGHVQPPPPDPALR